MVGPAGPSARHPGQVGHVDRPLGVGRDRPDGVGAQSEEAHGAVDRDVPLGAGDHPHGRRPVQATALDVPAGRGQHVLAGGGQADRICGLPAGHEAERGPVRQAEQVLQPPAGDVLDEGGAGEVTALKAFWSQPVVSTSAAVAASSAPPITNPK